MASLTAPVSVLFALAAFLAACVHATSTEVPLVIGAGCNFSDYANLPTSTSTDASSASAAFSFQYDGGHGKGLYVLHITSFRLPRDDVVVIRAKDGASVASTVALAGRNTSGDFFTKAVAGSGVVVELFKSTASADESPSSSAENCWGFAIDGLRFTSQAEATKVAVGDEAAITALALLPTDGNATTTAANAASEIKESLCGADESQEAACYENGSVAGGAAMYAASRAVARLVIRKDNNFNIAYCTGFLLGCEGHMITNQHCVRNWIDALNTGVEFFAEAAQCGNQSCLERAACPGRIRLRSAALVAVSTPYDYALLKLSPDDGGSIAPLLSQVGGYLQLRASGPKMDELVFIPQYPMGYGKRIASTAEGQPGRINSLSVSTCGGSDVGYNVDTQEGSSGSPVIATADNLVVALHHCGGCPNGGIPSTALIADMQQRGVLPACATA